jgi:hypothetical protein
MTRCEVGETSPSRCVQTLNFMTSSHQSSPVGHSNNNFTFSVSAPFCSPFFDLDPTLVPRSDSPQPSTVARGPAPSESYRTLPLANSGLEIRRRPCRRSITSASLSASM